MKRKFRERIELVLIVTLCIASGGGIFSLFLSVQKRAEATKKNIVTLQTDITTTLADNAVGGVSVADVRGSIIDTVESLADEWVTTSGVALKAYVWTKLLAPSTFIAIDAVTAKDTTTGEIVEIERQYRESELWVMSAISRTVDFRVTGYLGTTAAAPSAPPTGTVNTIDLLANYNSIGVDVNITGGTPAFLIVQYRETGTNRWYYGVDAFQIPDDTDRYISRCFNQPDGPRTIFPGVGYDVRVSVPIGGDSHTESIVTRAEPIKPVGIRLVECADSTALNNALNPANLESGDVIRLTSDGPYEVTGWDTTENDVTIEAEAGNTPVITGKDSQALTWVSEGSSVYSTTSITNEDDLAQVFVDGERFPYRPNVTVDHNIVTITSTDNLNPVAVNATAHGLTTNHRVRVAGVTTMTEINDRNFIVTVTDANNFTLNGEDGTGYTDGTGGTANQFNSVTITSTDNLNPVVVTATDHGFVNGDWVNIANVTTMTEINDKQFHITRTGANTFTLDGEDGTGYTDGTGGVANGNDWGWFADATKVYVQTRENEDPTSHTVVLPEERHMVKISGTGWWIENVIIEHYGKVESTTSPRAVEIAGSGHTFKNVTFRYIGGAAVDLLAGSSRVLFDSCTFLDEMKFITHTQMLVVVNAESDTYETVSAIVLDNINSQQVVIRDCTFTSMGDGLQMSYTSDQATQQMFEVSGCTFLTMVDDAIEIDGFVMNTLLLNNVIDTCRAGISLTPLGEGPLYVVGNHFLRIPYKTLGDRTTGATAILKTGTDNNGLMVIAQNTMVADDGVALNHGTGDDLTASALILGGPTTDFDDIRAWNNIMVNSASELLVFDHTTPSTEPDPGKGEWVGNFFYSAFANVFRWDGGAPTTGDITFFAGRATTYADFDFVAANNSEEGSRPLTASPANVLSDLTDFATIRRGINDLVGPGQAVSGWKPGLNP